MSAASTNVAAPFTRFEPYRYQPGMPPRSTIRGSANASNSGMAGRCRCAGTTRCHRLPAGRGRAPQLRPPGSGSGSERNSPLALSPQSVGCASRADLTRLRLLDLGDLRCDTNLEASQQALGDIIPQVLAARAIPSCWAAVMKRPSAIFSATPRRGCRSASSISTPISTCVPPTTGSATAARRFARPWNIRSRRCAASAMPAWACSRTA